MDHRATRMPRRVLFLWTGPWWCRCVGQSLHAPNSGTGAEGPAGPGSHLQLVPKPIPRSMRPPRPVSHVARSSVLTHRIHVRKCTECIAVHIEVVACRDQG